MTRSGPAVDPLQPVGSFPRVILPDPSRVFLDQSRRLESLAEGHSLGKWLSFLSRLTEMQHQSMQELTGSELTGGAPPESACESSLPPIPASSFPRDPSWRLVLARLARELAPHAPGPARTTLERLQVMDAAALENFAERVLRLDLDGTGANFLPFVAAALQVYWTALAFRLDKAHIGPSGGQALCPCCGFPPVAGIVRTGGEVPRLRYLHCALCNTEWNLVRVTCASCRDSDGIAYYNIDGSDGSVRAETCDACLGYLKIVDREKSPRVDPVADDLATLALDLLVEEAGYCRIGLNLLLSPSAGSGK